MKDIGGCGPQKKDRSIRVGDRMNIRNSDRGC